MYAHATQTTLHSRLFSRGAALLVLFLASTLGLLAQTVRWDPPGGKLPQNLISELGLIFENCEPKANPTVPKTPGLMLSLRPGRSESVSIINFTKTSTISLRFAVRLEEKKAVTIPAFTVETDKGPLTVPAVTFEPDQGGIGQANLSVEDIAQSNLIPGSNTVWAGEVIPLVYRMDVLRRYYQQVASVPEWDPAPLFVEEWSRGELMEGAKNAKGDSVIRVQYQTRVYAKDPGELTLNGLQQFVSVVTGSSVGFFGQQKTEILAVSTDQPTLTVRALPTPAPASFAGAVGQFKLASKVVPQKAKVGEPITWSLELSGTGNWPALQGLPARSVPKSFDLVTPQAKRTNAEGKLFDATLSEDVVMLPRQPGTYVIPPLSLSYFDPKSGSYRTLTTERVQLVIEPAAVTAAAGGTPAAAAVAKTPIAGNGEPPAPPAPPAPLPSDPVPGGTLSEVPMDGAKLPFLCLTPFVLLPVAWLTLAFVRARGRDPLHPRRVARSVLLRLVRQPTATDLQKRRLVRNWQEQVSRAFGLGTAAPSARQLSELLREQHIAGAKDWLELWSQADSYLFGNQVALPANWLGRATDCLRGLRIPRFNPLKTLLPRHLLPWFFALGLLLLALPASTAHAIPNASELYAKGDFAGAAAQWEASVRAHPTDWAARHNLGLALLQQNQPGPAAAQLAAALVQNPSDETLRRNFRLAVTQAGFVPVRAGDLAADHPVSDLARLAPPATWQWLLQAAALIAVAGLLLYLLYGYGLRFRLQRMLATLLAGGALLLAGASLAALARYGALADPRAALVRQNSTLRSIPTEADATQKTSAIQAGSLLVIDKAFLGWRHVTLPTGDSGWLRQTDLVPLWSAE
jgi:hypothetical protein